MRGLAVSPTDGRLHQQVRGKGLFRSFTGARTWERVGNGPGDGKIFRSSDGGTS